MNLALGSKEQCVRVKNRLLVWVIWPIGGWWEKRQTRKFIERFFVFPSEEDMPDAKSAQITRSGIERMKDGF